MASKIIYRTAAGTHEFSNPTTTVAQTPVLSSRTNHRVANSYTIGIRSLLIVSSTNIDFEIKTARDILSRAGGDFIWTDNGTPVLSFTAAEDINFGPQPTQLTFNRFWGTNAVQVEWQFNVELANQDSDHTEFFYTISTDLDKNMYSNRTIAGILKINPAKIKEIKASSADAYRKTIEKFTCKPAADWQRISQHYHTSADGLTLRFRIVDQQQFVVLPEGVTDGEVSLTAEGNPAVPPFRFTLRGFYEAAPHKPMASTVAFAQLAQSIFTTEDTKDGFIIKRVQVQKDVYKPRLNFSLTWDAYMPDKMPQGTIAGGSGSTKATNYLISLTTKAEDWLTHWRTKRSENFPPYGVANDVVGWCGSQEVMPALTMAADQNPEATLPPNRAGQRVTFGTPESFDQNRTANESYYSVWEQSFKYEIDYGRKVMSTMSGHADADQVQQVRSPRVFLYVRGKATRAFNGVDIPLPPINSKITGQTRDESDGVVLKQSITTSAPNTGPEFSAAWSYDIFLSAAMQGQENMAKYVRVPDNPGADLGIEYALSKFPRAESRSYDRNLSKNLFDLPRSKS